MVDIVRIEEGKLHMLCLELCSLSCDCFFINIHVFSMAEPVSTLLEPLFLSIQHLKIAKQEC